MDSRIKMYLFALVALGSLSVVTALVECYSCSYSYNNDEEVFDFQNCVNPSTTATTPTNTVMCPDTSRCSVRSSYSIGSGTPPTTNIVYTRGCEDQTTVCDTSVGDCRKNPSNCVKCCTGANCNTATLASHLRDNGLINTCYECQHADFPGLRSDSGCQQDAFNPTSTQVTKVDCQGLCFSAVALFEPTVAKSIVRGCLPHGRLCTYDGLQHKDVGGDIVNTDDGLRYEVSCCKGDDCNAATALSVGLATVLLSSMLAMVAVRM